MSSKKPGFFIIGAQKSGTTSLADALNRHSQVFVCEPMEPEYFSGAVRGNGMSREDYDALFSGAPEGVCCGEASTGTMLSEPVIPLLNEEAPGAKLIALLRAPEKRAYSAFAHDCKKGRVTVAEQGTIFDSEAAAYLAGQETRFDWFQRSEYARQLAPFRQAFGDRLKVVIFEELVAREAEVLGELQDFLGLRRETLSLTCENRSRVPKNKNAEALIGIGRKLIGPLRALMSERGYRHFRETLMAKLGKSPEGLSPELSALLREKSYQQDIENLEVLMGRKIQAWRQDFDKESNPTSGGESS